MRPTIGVSGPDGGGEAAWIMSALAVWRAGGRPRWIRPGHPVPVDDLDGLIVGGGADVDPGLYGAEAVSKAETEEAKEKVPLKGFGVGVLIQGLRRLLATSLIRRDDRGRDELEAALLEHAQQRNLPVLGICRGAQLMNVLRGGSLHQELTPFYVERPQLWTALPRKTVELRAQTRLCQILGRGDLDVNSLHRQAVDRIGEGLLVAACEPNGVVQAIEDPARSFYIGVQWHPEYLPQLAVQQRLFRALVEVARAPVSTRLRAQSGASATRISPNAGEVG